MLQVEVLVREAITIDRATASAIAARKVATCKQTIS